MRLSTSVRKMLKWFFSRTKTVIYLQIVKETSESEKNQSERKWQEVSKGKRNNKWEKEEEGVEW